MDKQKVIFRDLGKMEYKEAWDYQERLLQESAKKKSEVRSRKSEFATEESFTNSQTSDFRLLTSIQTTTYSSSSIPRFIH